MKSRINNMNIYYKIPKSYYLPHYQWMNMLKMALE